jgi:glycosyltransferase involved in cell wall biosynthesis
MSKIIFFSPHDLPRSHISRNFDYARRLVGLGHSVTIIANNFSHRDKANIVPRASGYYSPDVIDGVDVIWLNTIHYRSNGFGRALNSFSYMILALWYCFRNVKYVNYCIGDSVPPTAGLAAYLIAMVKGGNFIFQVRDVWPIALVHDKAIKKNSIMYFSLRILEKFLYKNCSKIFSTVPFLSSHVIESGSSSSKITYIPNGVDLNVINYSPLKRSVNGKIVVTYAGGFGNAHDAESIVRAAKILESSEFCFEFNFYGEGVKLESCKQLAKSLCLYNVNFYKSVEKKNLSIILSASNILVAAVSDSDAYQFGINLNKLYDYLAAGRPIILACRSPHRPVEDARCGYIVEPEHPEQLAGRILDISMSSHENQDLLGRNARQYAVSNYNLDNLVLVFEKQLAQVGTQ